MKLSLSIATTALLASSAGFAAAQSMFDGSVGVQYMIAPDDSYDYQIQIDGSLVYSVSPKIALQFDLGSVTYEGDGFTDLSYGIHGIYALSDTIDVGVFYASQNYSQVPWYNFYGVEAAYNTGPIRVEAFATIEDEASGADIYYMFGAEAGYMFDLSGPLLSGIEVYAGAALEYYSDGSQSNDNYYVGVKAGLGENFVANARYASMDWGAYNYITLGVSYEFGEGARFTARDYGSTFPGY